MIFITASAEETQKIAQELLKNITPSKNGATILALEGDLGSGKTTFLQGLAKNLGIKEKILSPTFVIMKKYQLSNYPIVQLSNFYHFDCYRLEYPKEVLALGFSEIIKEPQNLVAIEWAEKIKNILPAQTIWLEFEHLGGDQRKIQIFN